jgi:excisionase family DNA binding protein
MPMYRLREAAALLGVSDDTIRRWADAGRLPTSTDDAGRRVLDGADLAAFAVSLADQPDEPSTSSMRNRFPGIVTRVVRGGVAAQGEV